MFKSALLKLTALYLLIIMVISLFFSAIIYQLAARELGRGFRNQAAIFDDAPPNLPSTFKYRLENKRAESLEEATSNLFTALFFTNAAILILGGGLSYVLARRSLNPIEDAHRSLERFTADASHELRTPITAMRSEIEVALMQPKLSASEAKAVLKSNLEEIDSLTNLTDGLLSLAQLGEISVNIKKQPLQPVINTAVKKTSASAKRKNISIKVDYSKDNIKALIDKNLFTEVLVTIIDNAVKYSHKNSSIEISISAQKHLAVVNVADHGIGIAQKDLDHVFDRFYRSDTARSKQGSAGHGLGLSIANHLIQQQNGTIKVSSKIGQGSVFSIMIPTE